DKTLPVITVEGVSDGLAYNHEVTPTVNANEESKVEYKLNGEAYELTTLSEEGQYTLEVIATDKAGNVSNTSVNFEIDKTRPVITINDVVNGMKYDKEVKPTISVDDENAEVVVTLNDNNYDGLSIKEEGKYTLKVVATDLAGNTSEKVVSFEIKFPEKDNTNPTPTPEPGDGGNTNIGGGTTNDNQGNGSGSSSSNSGSGNNGTTGNGSLNIKPSGDNVGKGNLPSTGQDRVIYIAVFALVLVVIGGVLVFKKKKVKEEK
ncbi:Ig-like domain repeat protein, partial [Clostridium saudiense]|nr:Ig-like domain repeat protein [Clostridium saudiense]